MTSSTPAGDDRGAAAAASDQPDGGSDSLTDALHHYFGFPAFRERQEEIVRLAVEGRDALALMPTGAGKSLCYQLAAMLRPEPTLVISPLIALMKDQVDNLPPEVARQSTLVNSSLDPLEASRRVQALARGEVRLLYVAPERLRQRQFLAALRSAGQPVSSSGQPVSSSDQPVSGSGQPGSGSGIGLVVIDEVHCVSMWGHDFRPDYLFIRTALEALGRPPILGLTATAAPATVEDIQRSLGRQMDVIRTTVERPNLRYEVEQVANEEERMRAAVERAKGLHGSGIVYARSREKCETLARLLQRHGVRASHYHAGLEAGERTRVQDRFLSGDTRVIVATTAFGMGIDKPDIRWVLLYNFPNSIESYVQMVGRAGRDGEESECVLFAGSADASSLRRFARADLPAIDTLRAVYRSLRQLSDHGWTEVTPEELARAAGLPDDDDPRVLAGMLERVELVRRDFDAGRAMRFELMPPPADTAKRIETLLDRYGREALARADRLVNFADAHRCRHLQVAEHFGERVATPCGMCDVCAPKNKRVPVSQAHESRPLPKNIAQSILDTVDGLYRPLGISGLAKTLRGSIEAPPTGQRSDQFGILATIPKGSIERWINQLIDAGYLEQFESEDGYKLLRRGARRDAPGLVFSSQPAESAPLSSDDAVLFERLKSWRSARARDIGMPAYIVLSDTVLRLIAGERPVSRRDLMDIKGMGPKKVEQYGEEILALLDGNGG